MRRRIDLYALVLPLGLIVGFIVLLATSQGLRTIRGGRIGGDLPAFYGAARTLRTDPSRLYDWDTQRDAQRDLLPPATEGWIAYAYPPLVAAAYLPLTWLPFKAAYAIHTLVMAALCVIAMTFVGRALPALRPHRVLLIAAALGFYPIFRAVLGGQNTAFSLTCAAGAAAALTAGNATLAGLWLGAWLFKPQLALPVAAIVALKSPHRMRLLSGVAVFGVIYYAVGAAIGGAAWPIWWWRAGVVPFSKADQFVDRANAISLPELASSFGVPIAGWIAAVVIAGVVVWRMWRSAAPPITVVASAAATAVLIAPHALFYDAGLALLGLIVCAARRPRWLPAVAAVYLVTWTQPFRAALPIPPLTVAVAVALGLCLLDDQISGTSSYSPQTSRSASHISPTVA
jgi:hypothetical protein